VAESEAEIEEIKDKVLYIADYIKVARSEIISKKLTEILKESSVTDQLTGFYNRKFLDEFADTIATPQAERAGITYGVLMIDIDFFKLINDKYGHDVGDDAIRVVSKVIKNSIRASDLAIRFGGEEFLVLLYNCKEEFILEVAEKIRLTFASEKIFTGKESFSKTLSIGAAFYPKDSPSIWKCIKFADIALYEAKEGGRNKVVRFDISMADDELKKGV
jgi:diguanylate cyclase (GGDEF)-like protein